MNKRRFPSIFIMTAAWQACANLSIFSESTNNCEGQPSVVVEKETNTLINPMHPDIEFVKIARIVSFSFDSRFFEVERQ